MFVHIVFFKFVPEDKEKNIGKVMHELKALVEQIGEIKTYEVGQNLKKGDEEFDLALYSTFENEESYRTYAAHPSHQQVLSNILMVTSERKAVDYTL